jgi:hypothetical protein
MSKDLSFGALDPRLHVHPCPECYRHVACSEDCTIEPDRELDDGTGVGAHFICEECSTCTMTADERQLTGSWDDVRQDLIGLIERVNRQEADIRALYEGLVSIGVATDNLLPRSLRTRFKS